MRESGWTIGSCIEATAMSISFSHQNVVEGLQSTADLFETEFDLGTKTVSLGRVEFNKDNPLPLAYGKGNGFKGGTGRSNYDDSFPVEILYVEGGETNIDASTYGSSELLLPKSQEYTYEGRTYVTDADGLSIRRADKDVVYNNEDSLDCTHIYPYRIGTVTDVVVVDEENNWYDIIDDTIPEALDFSECLISGETMTIIFQSGMLATREFNIETNDNGDLIGYDHTNRLFQLVPQEYSGIAMPGGVYVPAIGDTYAVFNCALPEAYICDNSTQTGASWDMFKEACKNMYENEDPNFTFTGELDSIYSKKNWDEIGGRIVLGGYVSFSDANVEGAEVRIVNIKEFIHKPYSPVLDLSNTTVGSTVASELKKIETTEVVIEDSYKSSINYTKRSFRAAKEAQELIAAAVGVLDTKFTDSISPITISTMSLLAGEESLQFQFIKAKPTSDTDTSEEIILQRSFNTETKIFSMTNPYVDEETIILQHRTLDIEDVTYARSELDYKCWTLSNYSSPALADSEATYYVYAKCSVSEEVGNIIISTTPIGMRDNADYYHFWIGILGAEYDGLRTYSDVYGYTEVLPGQVITKVIRSADGETYFNLSEGEIGGRIVFVNTSGTTATVADGINTAQSTASGAQTTASNALDVAQGADAEALAATALTNTIKNAIAQQLGYTNYDAFVASAKAQSTIIDGGYINTALIEVATLLAGQVLANAINVGNGRFQVNSYGLMTTEDALIKGTIRTPFQDGYYVMSETGNVTVSTLGINDNNCVVIPGSSAGWGTAFTVPFTSDYNGFRSCIINKTYNGVSAVGYISASASSGMYFYENGVSSTKLEIEINEGVEMIGLGKGDTFMGWVILNRFNC